tara:strand:- start:157 stop:522 length:366 start_codon:yes stop_codon:yes gene_type:complete
MNDLIKKLEAAEVGSRELDFHTHYAHKGDLKFYRDYIKRWGKDASSKAASHWGIPHYTTSLDAALTLVPEGWEEWEVNLKSNGLCYAKISMENNVVYISEQAPTRALALCIAAIKARDDVS